MTLFACRARDAQGRPVQAEIEAASAAAAAAQLMADEMTPVRIDPAPPRTDARRLGSPRRPGDVDPEEILVFCRHMHRLARAGVPLLHALGGLAESRRHVPFGEVLSDVAERVGSGRTLSDALARHPRVFSPLFVSMMRMGEQTGRIDTCFDQLRQYIEFERETRRRVTAALRYPAFVVLAVVGALILLNLFVLPAFARVFEGFGADLPWATRLLLSVSDAAIRLGPWVLLSAGIAATAVHLRLATPEGRVQWDRWKLRLPLLGSILKRATLARFARAFAMAFSAGLPVLQSLELVGDATDNTWVGARIQGMRESVEHGQTLTRAAALSGVFEPLELQMLSVGEETGSLAEMAAEIAAAYEVDVDYEVNRLSETIEPILMLILGGVVLVLALGVYLPMWDLAAAARGGA